MGNTYTVTKTMYTIECSTCGILFGISDRMDDVFRETHETFYCPKGHVCRYSGKTKAEKLQEELDKEIRIRESVQRSFTQTAQELDIEKRRRAAAVGQHTKTKNRIAKGVCPCCNRSFTNLHAHMTTQHPGYAEPNRDLLNTTKGEE